jgi:hypothetical protein
MPIEETAPRRDPVTLSGAVIAGGLSFAGGTTLAAIGITSVFWSAVAIAGVTKIGRTAIRRFAR